MGTYTDPNGVTYFYAQRLQIERRSSGVYLDTTSIQASGLVIGNVLTYIGAGKLDLVAPSAGGALNDLFINTNPAQTAAATGLHAVSLGNNTTNSSDYGLSAMAGATTTVPGGVNFDSILNLGGSVFANAGSMYLGGTIVAGADNAAGIRATLNLQNPNGASGYNILIGAQTKINTSYNGVNPVTFPGNLLFGASQLNFGGAMNGGVGSTAGQYNIMFGGEQVTGIVSNFSNNLILRPDAPFSVAGATGRTGCIEAGTGATVATGLSYATAVGPASACTASCQSFESAYGYGAVANGHQSQMFGAGKCSDAQTTAIGAIDNNLTGAGALVTTYPTFSRIQANVQTQLVSNTTTVAAPALSATCGLVTMYAKCVGSTPVTFDVLNPRWQPGSIVRLCWANPADPANPQNLSLDGNSFFTFNLTCLGDATAGVGFKVNVSAWNSTGIDTGVAPTIFYEILYPTTV